MRLSQQRHMPLFSIIIPTYNRKALLQEALHSVFSQECQDFETIVVDDGSTDGTLEYLESLGARIRLIIQENLGPGAARNAGIRAAHGDYVAFLDSDDVWFPWTLSSYRTAIEACDQPSFLCGDCIRFNHVDEICKLERGALAYDAFQDYLAAWPQRIWIGVCSAVIKTPVLQAIGGFAGGFINAEDSDLWLRLGIAPGFVHLKNPLVFGYRQHAQAVSSNESRTLEGIRQMILNEQQGRYPGGKSRRRDRLEIITAHLRPASIGSALRGDQVAAVWLYTRSFFWQLQLGRFRYLAALPVLVVRGFVANRLTQKK